MKTTLYKALSFTFALAMPFLVSGQEESQDSTTSSIPAVTDEEIAISQLDGEKRDFIFNFAGYTDLTYASKNADGNNLVTAKFAPIVQLLISERLFFEAEGEFEYAKAEGESREKESALEYASLHYVLNDHAIISAGKFLSPVGQFVQNLHPSWINKMPTMPIGFAGGHHGSGAAPITEIGVQLRGGFAVKKDSRLNYAVFVSNGPNMIVEEEEDESLIIEGLDTSAIWNDINDNKSVGLRLGYLPVRNLEIGLSFQTAKAGVGPILTHGEEEPHDEGEEEEHEEEEIHEELTLNDRDYNVFAMDFYYAPQNLRNFAVRGEYIRSLLGAAGHEEYDPGRKVWEAWYTQAGYTFTEKKLEIVTRYGEYRPEGKSAQRQLAFGVNYLFSNRTMMKASYELNDNAIGGQDRFVLQVAHGF